MARLPRFVRAHLAVHATARGVDGCRLFRSGSDQRKYLKRFALVAEEEGVEIHGYCLLANHVHFLLVPKSDKALARLFLRVHTWWAMYFNAKYHRTGHLFQGRFYSAVLDKAHYWAALRYIETNPRKHNLSADLARWEYSSARQHLTGQRDEFIQLMMDAWHRRFTTQTYRGFLEESATELAARLEKSLARGLPCGADKWVKRLERKAKRRLHALPPGRPPRPQQKPRTFAA
jgi:putative transposase